MRLVQAHWRWLADRLPTLLTMASHTTSTFGMSLLIFDKNGLRKEMCLLYARLLHMWSRLNDSFHGCDMDNFYTTMSLTWMVYTPPKHVLIRGVMYKTRQGVSPCLI